MSTIGFAFKRFWNSEAGPKTVHFWAPTMKWALVVAGLSDLKRPVEKLSGSQYLALLATGTLWTRWSFVIRPKNYLLASVNFFLACTASTQIMRMVNYRLENGDTWKQACSYLFKGLPSIEIKDEQQPTLDKQVLT